MQQLLLHLLLLWLTTMLTSAGNALLEDYERKLNSISGKLEWRRIPGRHRIKRYRCIEEYVDEHGNVIEEGKEHLTTSIPPRFISNDREPVKVAPRKKTKDSALKKISNTVKVKLMRRKPKARGVITENRRQPNGDEYSADTKVDYVTSTANSASSKSMKTRATEFSGQNNEDDVILRKYFPADLGGVQPSTTYMPPRTTMLLPASHKRRQQLKLSRSHKTFENDYDDYWYTDDIPYYRLSLGTKPARRYAALPRRGMFPKRRLLRSPRVTPMPQYLTPHSRYSGSVPPVSNLADTSSQYTSVVRPALRELQKEKTFGKLPAVPFSPPQATLNNAPVPLPPPPTTVQQVPLTPAPLPSTTLEDSTPETCSRMQRLATAFGISDISSYVRKNCTVLLVFAPGFTCEQITYFVDSCHKKSFL